MIRRGTSYGPALPEGVLDDDGARDLPPFVVTRGGEYCFAPGLQALRWLGELGT